MYLNLALDKGLRIFGRNKKYPSNYLRDEGYRRREGLDIMTKNIKLPAYHFPMLKIRSRLDAKFLPCQI